MAKPTDDKPTSAESNPAAQANPAGDAARPAPAAGTPVKVDDSGVAATYANFCRVTGTPEELIVDFALNPQPFGVPHESIVISQRIVLNHYTAKRLLAALTMSVQRHEAAFGVLETDVQKRVLPGVWRQQQPPRTQPNAPAAS